MFFEIPHPIDQANIFAYSYSFTIYALYLNDMLDQRGKAVNML